MTKKKHYNEHRAWKIRFEANLTIKESVIIDKVMKVRGFKSKRDLVVALCKKELK